MAPGPVSPSAKSVPALRAVALAMRLVDNETRRAINASTKSVLGDIWGQELAGKITTDQDALVLFDGATVKPGNPAKVVAGASRKPLSDGLVPVDHNRAFEFGAPTRIPHEETYQRTSPLGTSHRVTRHTKRQVPKATRQGRVVYPAWAETAPRMVSLWAQIIVKTIYDASEKR